MWLWVSLVRGSSVCLFLGLPLAYFFHETDGLFSRRVVVKRLLAALVQVLLIAVIIIGSASVLQVRPVTLVLRASGCDVTRSCVAAECVQRDVQANSALLSFPLTFVSAMEILPGMLILMVAAPVRYPAH